MSRRPASLRPRRIRPLTGADRWGRSVYREAFPASERLPWAVLHALSLRPGIDLIAWYDVRHDDAAGARAESPSALTWTVRRRDERLLYLFYLAVDPAARGRCVGSRLLAEFSRRHPGCTIVLDVEPVVDDAPNAEQRRRRLAFYERAGFRDTGLALTDATGDYWPLVKEADGSPFTEDAYRSLLRHLDLGLTGTRLGPRR